MDFIRGRHNLRAGHRGCVATIGNFDGVHRGHQAMLARLRELGGEHALPSTLLTFEPHPLEYLRPELAPARLSSLRDKLRLLSGAGVDRVVCLRFNRALAELSAEEFVASLLVEGLGVRALLIGDDFRFGRGRQGDVELLRRLGERYGYQVLAMPTLSAGGERISSTRVRQALAAGDLDQARALLGHPYIVSGRVVRGRALGRELGFPTANLAFGARKPALNGIFVVTVHGLGEPRPGVASVGTRPTVSGVEPLLEVHLLDFAGDLYGRELRVEFLQRLRAEERFASVEAMRRQIVRDAEQARHFFASITG